ncbi:MarR family winged helix-turn-helix transcriptional regulator [Nocardia mangyaensis]|uniref:MarR family winged helix-turn-helix transcriptional regulator n=1 Tax=Nocardia mangyaensis TaxID=2213200 RepID=UPI001F0A65B7|nr:winged helix DNA-binding protein [Nocardia mangyaensis]
MGELVAHLERFGYVAREPDPADRRARLIVATASGRAALALAARHIHRIEQALAAELGPESLDRLRAALARVPAAIADPSDPPSESGRS